MLFRLLYLLEKRMCDIIKKKAKDIHFVNFRLQKPKEKQKSKNATESW